MTKLNKINEKWLKENFDHLTTNELCDFLKISKSALYKAKKELQIGPKSYFFTKYQINFILENYPNKGADFCAKTLNLDKQRIISKASRMGIKYTQEFNSNFRSQRFLDNASPEYLEFAQDFISIKTKFHAYILGLLWADGYINPTNNNIQLSLQIKDGIKIKKIIRKTGDWCEYLEKPYGKGKEIMLRFCKSNIILFNFLEKNDYLIKSGASANKILSLIPKKFINYWFQGFFDGDGHIGNNRNKKLMFSATYNQNWEFLTNKCESLGINTHIRRFINKKGGKASECYLSSSYESLYKFFKFIYTSNFDCLAFKRKFNRFIYHFNPQNKKSNFFKSNEFLVLQNNLQNITNT